MIFRKFFNLHCLKPKAAPPTVLADKCESVVKSDSKRKKSNSSNPFFIYLNEFREDLRERGVTPQPSITEAAKMAGARWRQMSNHDKLTYYVWARKNKERKNFLKLREEQLKRNVDERFKKIKIEVPASELRRRKINCRGAQTRAPTNFMFTYIK